MNGPGGQAEKTPRRVTDAEREAVGQMLSDAVLNGMLTRDEWENRNAMLPSARTEEDLRKLYTDLTGTSLPTLVLSVDRAWYAHASRVIGRCTSMRFVARTAAWSWVFLPIVIYAATDGADYENFFNPAYVWFLGAYSAYLATTTVMALMWAVNLGTKVVDVLEQAGVER